MKNLQTGFIIIAVALFFTACEKDEIIENYNSISGVLAAGENMVADDLSGISIHLGKLFDEIDPATVTSETEEIDLVEELGVNADGSFTFNKLLNGNYVLELDQGFKFAQGKFIIVSLDGISKPKLNELIVEREKPLSQFDIVCRVNDYYVGH